MRTFLIHVVCLLALATLIASCGAPPAFTLLDGTRVNADQLGYVAKNPRLLDFLRGSKDAHVTIFTSPQSCPSYFFHSSSTTTVNPNLDAHRDQCSRAVAARMVDYPERIRTNCRCITFAQGQANTGFRVVAANEFARDTTLNAIATIVERRGDTKSTIRGFMAVSLSTGEFKLSNEQFIPVCTGSLQLGGGNATLSCFNDSIKLSGTYQRGEDATLSGRLYGIGRFQSPDGMRLDFAVNLTDQELRKRRPNFPD